MKDVVKGIVTGLEALGENENMEKLVLKIEKTRSVSLKCKPPLYDMSFIIPECYPVLLVWYHYFRDVHLSRTRKILKFTCKNLNGKLIFYPCSLPSSRTFYHFIHLWNIPKFFGLAWGGLFRRAWGAGTFEFWGSGVLYQSVAHAQNGRFLLVENEMIVRMIDNGAIWNPHNRLILWIAKLNLLPGNESGDKCC